MARPAGRDDDKRREQRRLALLDAGLELFASRGYHGTSIEELCRQAHVSTKSFYGVYPSREDCYVDLMNELSNRVIASITDAVTNETFEADDGGAEDRLVAVLAHLVGDDPRVAIVLFGRGAATTFVVEAARRVTRRQAVDLVHGVWELALPDVLVAPGVGAGTVGGLSDIVSDWADGIADASGNDRVADAAVLEERLLAFYRTVRAGLSYGKAALS